MRCNLIAATHFGSDTISFVNPKAQTDEKKKQFILKQYNKTYLEGPSNSNTYLDVDIKLYSSELELDIDIYVGIFFYQLGQNLRSWT